MPSCLSVYLSNPSINPSIYIYVYLCLLFKIIINKWTYLSILHIYILSLLLLIIIIVIIVIYYYYNIYMIIIFIVVINHSWLWLAIVSHYKAIHIDDFRIIHQSPAGRFSLKFRSCFPWFSQRGERSYANQPGYCSLYPITHT
jgi:hypothetical protein